MQPYIQCIYSNQSRTQPKAKRIWLPEKTQNSCASASGSSPHVSGEKLQHHVNEEDGIDGWAGKTRLALLQIYHNIITIILTWLVCTESWRRRISVYKSYKAYIWQKSQGSASYGKKIWGMKQKYSRGEGSGGPDTGACEMNMCLIPQFVFVDALLFWCAKYVFVQTPCLPK